MPHTIRLRGPWRCEPFRGLVRYKRRFGCPTGLMPGDQVHLAIEKVEGEAEVLLNGEVLGHVKQRPARLDVTSLLRQSNELTIDVHLPATGHEDRPDGLPGLVSLEITSAQLPEHPQRAEPRQQPEQPRA